jgi:hypothetical protein
MVSRVRAGGAGGAVRWAVRFFGIAEVWRAGRGRATPEGMENPTCPDDPPELAELADDGTIDLRLVRDVGEWHAYVRSVLEPEIRKQARSPADAEIMIRRVLGR